MKTRVLTIPILLSVFLLTFSSYLQAGTITYNPKKPTVGDIIKFTNTGTFSSCITWHLGDGAKKDGTLGSSNMSHSYKKAGTYHVKAWDTNCDDGGAPTATVTIKINPKVKKGSITYKPRNPEEGDEITLTQSAFVLEEIVGQFLFSKAEEATSGGDF